MSQGQVQKLAKGTKLFSEGETSQDLFILQHGVVKIYKVVDGKELPLAIIKQGQFIGELSFFDGLPRSATAEAATDITALKISKDDMDKVMKSLPSWLLTLVRSIAIRVRDAGDLVQRNHVVDESVAKEFELYK